MLWIKIMIFAQVASFLGEPTDKLYLGSSNHVPPQAYSATFLGELHCTAPNNSTTFLGEL
jgi:hypothetical protein